MDCEENCEIKFTGEHIPPQALFRQSNRMLGGTITVSCCYKCNSNYSKLDDYWLSVITHHAYKLLSSSVISAITTGELLVN